MARRTTRSATPSLIATRLSGKAASRPLTLGMLPSGDRRLADADAGDAARRAGYSVA
jgi:hypothetical protein